MRVAPRLIQTRSRSMFRSDSRTSQNLIRPPARMIALPTDGNVKDGTITSPPRGTGKVYGDLQRVAGGRYGQDVLRVHK